MRQTPPTDQAKIVASASTNPPVSQAVKENPGAQVVTPGPQAVKAKSFAKVFNVNEVNPGAQVVTPGAQVVKAKPFAKAVKANPIVQTIVHRPPVTLAQTRVAPPSLGLTGACPQAMPQPFPPVPPGLT